MYTHGLSKTEGEDIKDSFTYSHVNFFPPQQLRFIYELTRDKEEGDHYRQWLENVENRVMSMPIAREESHEHEGKPKAYIKYFDLSTNRRWYIFNRDCSDEQIQCFGSMPDTDGYMEDGRWLGYINLPHLFMAYPYLQMDQHYEPGEPIIN
jgi:hypothetical protein